MFFWPILRDAEPWHVLQRSSDWCKYFKISGLLQWCPTMSIPLILKAIWQSLILISVWLSSFLMWWFLVGLGTGKLEAQPHTPQTARCCVGGSAWAAAAWALERECNEQPLQNCLLTSKELARKTINNSLVNVCWNLPLDADHFIPPWGGWFFNVMNPNYMRRDPYLWNWLVIGWWYFFLIDGMGGKSK